MNGGRIQQAAPPMEVYERPANTFVASFIGTPPMNLFPPGMLDLGRIVGVRPENIRISNVDSGINGLTAVVDLIEPLGCETLVHCITENRSVKVTVRIVNGFSNTIRTAPGDRVTLLPDMNKAIIFG
jgi:multiple sugar transport system ATP-binding protein